MIQEQVLGFDRASRRWVEAASGETVVAAPLLDGELLVNDQSLSNAADDFGHFVHLWPSAVLAPRSSEDVVRIVNFGRQHGIKIGPRGQAMNGSGLSQVEGGIVIKMSTLDLPITFRENSVEVNAGMTWREVLAATLKRGLRPPVLAQALYLSVGGTLSVAGIDGTSFHHGAQVDNVLELQVVTGEGRVETCSPSLLPELYDAVLSGLGQCAVILRVAVPLIPARSHVRTFELLYRDLPTMLDDEASRVTDGRFDSALGFALPSASGGWMYHLRADREFNAPEAPRQEEILSGLNHIHGFERVADQTFYDCVARGLGHGVGHWYRGRVKQPHPWFAVVVPDSTIGEFAGEMLSVLKASAVEPDFVIEFYRINIALSSRPLFRLPAESGAFAVVFLSSYSGPDADLMMETRSRRFFERARARGGTWIPSSALRLSHQEWGQHFGASWQQFAAAKRRFDPDNILTPGPGIF